MKHKLLTVLLTLIAVLCLAFGLVACDNGGKGGNGGNGEESGDGADLWTVERLYAEAQTKGFEGSLNDLIALFKGDKGDKGTDGKDGKDGIGIKSVEIDENGHLKVTLTDGTVLDAGKVAADEPIEEGTEGLQYQKLKGENGEYTAAVVGLGTAWDTDIVIPSTYRGLKVTAIGDSAFSASRGGLLSSIEIPDSIISIGSYAFSGRSELMDIAIPDSVTSIGGGAFSGCSGLTEIDFPKNLTSIGDHAFDGCDGLTEIKFPDNLTSIGDYAFSGCDGLKNILYGTAMTSIGIWAFSYCNGLTEITVPSSVTIIGDGAFISCCGLISATIESKTIGNYAFQGCDMLKNVTLGSGVTLIEHGAFSSCNSLESVTFAEPNGWKGYSGDSTTPSITFTSERLSDTFYAVMILNSDEFTLKRSV